MRKRSSTWKEIKHPPKWVSNAIKHFKYPSVATGTLVCFYLKGKHYKYKIVDNNYNSFTIYRKQR